MFKRSIKVKQVFQDQEWLKSVITGTRPMNETTSSIAPTR